MTSENYVFGLDAVGRDPIGYAPAQSTTYANASTSVGAEYQVLAQGFVNDNAISGLHSPACDGGNCLVVGGGPGVTTLSIGEEDGNGEYLARAVVDGVEFLEPPISTFTSAGDFEFATLAIGEDSGAVVSVPAPIGEPVYSVQTQTQPLPTEWSLALEDPEYVVQADPAPVYFEAPAPALTYSQGPEVITIPIETVPMEQVYAAAAPVFIPVDPAPVEPIFDQPGMNYEYEYIAPEPDPSRFTMAPIVSQPAFEPYTSAPGYEFSDPVEAAAAPFAPAPVYEPAIGAIQTVPIVEPRQKPGLFASPAPVAKADDGRITVEYSAPRAKPASEVFTNGSPVPYIRPESTDAAPVMTFDSVDMPAPVPASSAPVSEAIPGDYVSVGSYDSYEATLGGATVIEGETPAVTVPDAMIEETAPMVEPEVLYTPGASLVPGTDAAAGFSDTMQPAEILEPVAVAEPETVVGDGGAPAMEAAAGSEIAAQPDGMIEPAAMPGTDLPDMPTVTPTSEVEAASIRMVDPEAVTESTSTEIGLGSATDSEAPLLSEEDFRITTLALGEEDGG